MIIISIRRFLYVSSGIFLLAIGGLAFYFWLEGPLGTNFHKVSSKGGALYRSALLDADELTHYVNKHNLKTVVNLRGKSPDEDWYQTEKQTLNKLGVELVNVRLDSESYPHPHELLQLIDAFENKPRPMLIHCYSGADRAGLAAAVHHILNSSPDEIGSAHQHLALFPYGHLNWGQSGRLDAFIDYYNSYRTDTTGHLSFKKWVEQKYSFTE